MKIPYNTPDVQVLNIYLEHDVLAASNWNDGSISDDNWHIIQAQKHLWYNLDEID